MGDQQQVFTQDARRALILAQEEAEREGHPYINTKHLLLALLRDREGVAGEILHALGLDSNQVEALTRKTERPIFAPAPRWNEQPQALLILDETGNLLVSNEAAQDLTNHQLNEVVNTLQRVGGASEVAIGDRTYFTLSGRLSDKRTFVVMQDITPVKEAEREKRDFVSAMLHDARTPIVAIKGYADLLRNVHQLDERSQHLVDRICFHADSMGDFITYWSYTHSLAYGNGPSLDRQACDLTQLVNEVMDHLQGAPSGSLVRFELNLSGEDFRVSGNYEALHRVIWLLVYSAIHAAFVYSYANPDRLRSNEVSISLHRDETDARLRVQFQPQIDPEERMSFVRRVEYRAIRAIVGAHDGKFEITSSPDRGTEFVVVLPATQA